MRRFKVLIAIIVVAAFSLWGIAGFVETTSYKYEAEAKYLYEFGLFDGTAVGTFEPDLGLALNRVTAITLIVKILGKRSEAERLTLAEADEYLKNYTDAPSMNQDWQRKFMGYAIKNKMVKGTSQTTLSPLAMIKGVEVATIILLNLGHEVKDYTKSLEELHKLGGLRAEQVEEFNKSVLLRDDIVGIGFGCLKATDSRGVRLIDMLVIEKKVRTQSLKEAGILPIEPMKIPFEVTNILPRPDSKDALDNTDITVTFLKSIDKTSVTDRSVSVKKEKGDSVVGNIYFANNDTTLIFKPAKKLDASSRYLVMVSGVKSMEGDIAKEYSSAFQTSNVREGINNITFYKSAVTPLRGGNSELVVQSGEEKTVQKILGDDSLQTGEFEVNFNEAINLDVITLSSIFFYDAQANESLNCTIVNQTATKLVLSLPKGASLMNKAYQLNVHGISLPDGSPVSPFMATISTGSRWSINVVGGPERDATDVKGRIEDGFKIQVDLGRAVKRESISISSIYLKTQNNFIVDATLDYDEEKSLVTLTPKVNLEPETTYELVMGNLVDKNGIKSESTANGEYTFTTGK